MIETLIRWAEYLKEQSLKLWQTYWPLVQSWSAYYEREILFVGTLLLAIAAVYWVIKGPYRRKKGTPRHKDTDFAAVLVRRTFDEAVAKKQMSKKTAGYFKQLIGKKCDMPDLLPLARVVRKVHPAKLTDMKNRLRAKFLNVITMRRNQKPEEEPAKKKATFKKYLNKAA